jgi:hypothetical protein
MEDEKQYHLIDDYLSGELQGTALDKFKIDLKHSDKLRQQVDLQSAIIKKIIAHREAELKAILKKEQHSTFKAISIKSNIRIAMSIAASVILLVATYFYLSKQQPNVNSTFVADNQTDEVKKKHKIKNKRRKDTSTKRHLATTHVLPANEIGLSVQDATDFDVVEEIEVPMTEDYVERDISKDAIVKSDKIVIERDELIGTRLFSLQSLDYATNTQYKNLDATEQTVNTPNSKVGTKAEIKTEDKQTASQAEIDIPQGSKINVEYWKSVVNFKGYIYDGTKVQLYGIPQNKVLIFKELDNRIYLALDNKHYFIEKNKTYKKFSEVSNPTLLNILND